MRFFSFLVSLVLSLTSWVGATDYQEHLFLKPLPNSALLAAFNFQSNTTISAFEQQNFRFFPRSLGQILQHTHTKELHLRFSLGRWDAENWGARPRGGRREGGTGVELWAWIDAETAVEANARWLTLTNALSGLFCASLNFIDSTKTIRPASTFEPEGIHPNASFSSSSSSCSSSSSSSPSSSSSSSPSPSFPSSSLHLLHGALPHEVVCTENLTPFLKLLPCKAKAGISSLLDGHKLFDASWQTMAIDVRPVCPSDGSECQLEIEQTVDMVLDIERSMRPLDDPIPRPPPIETIHCDPEKNHNHETCYPIDRTTERAWSISQVFGRPIRGACPLSKDPEIVHLELSPDIEIEVQSLQANASHLERKSDNNRLRHFQLPTTGDFDLSIPEQPLISPSSLEQPRIYASRTFVGYGQERGGVRAVLTNPSTSEPVEIVYLESLPWFMKPYLHTLAATISPPSTSTDHGSSNNDDDDPIKQISYRPAIDRHHGTHLELHLSIPASATVTLTYDFEKAILRYTEYPPDANRGFDVAPAIIRLLPRSDNNSSNHNEHDGNAAAATGHSAESTYLRTTSLLLPLPTPDFSMPYNVIILTSTVIAMAFGSVFNLIARRFVAVDEVPRSKIAILRHRLGGKVAAVRTKAMAGWQQRWRTQRHRGKEEAMEGDDREKKEQ